MTTEEEDNIKKEGIDKVEGHAMPFEMGDMMKKMLASQGKSSGQVPFTFSAPADMMNDIMGDCLPPSSVTMSSNPFSELLSGKNAGPLAAIMSNLSTILSGKAESSTLTVSGTVGESRVSIDVTDEFTGEIANDIIRRVVNERMKAKAAETAKEKENNEVH